jgi:hypothetical protein
MAVFEWIVVLLLVSVLLAGAARRVGAPYPAFLALGGAATAAVAVIAHAVVPALPWAAAALGAIVVTIFCRTPCAYETASTSRSTRRACGGAAISLFRSHSWSGR